MEFLGYKRPDGKVGIRNYLLVVSTVVCANGAARKIASQLSGAVSITHEHGCGSHYPLDRVNTHKTLVGFGVNPNVGACIVVGLGCEGVDPEKIAADIAESGKPVECIIIQNEGGTINSVSKGTRIGRKMLADLSQEKRTAQDISNLILALECGGSDTTSGIAANPALGVASDMLIDAGGSSILSETTELVGAEHILVERAINKQIAEDIINVIERAETHGHAQGHDMSNLAPGNKKGGLSTVEDKSLGCVHKGGISPVHEVVEYADKPTQKGLIIMDTPGYDIESITGMVAGGAQVVVFTTGRGTPVGCPIAPVIKVTGNTATFLKMEDNIDINAGKIVDGESTVKEVGQEIFEEILAAANGKLVKAEQLDLGEFAIYRGM